MLVYKLVQLNYFDWSNDNVDLKMSDDWLLSTCMCMTSWKSYTHKYVQFKAKFRDIYVPESMIIVGMRLLCRNNFGNNQMEKELRIIPE